MYWLITYSQLASSDRNRTLIANTATKLHPADWLCDTVKSFPDADTKLLFSMEINQAQFKKVRDNV